MRHLIFPLLCFALLTGQAEPLDADAPAPVETLATAAVPDEVSTTDEAPVASSEPLATVAPPPDSLLARPEYGALLLVVGTLLQIFVKLFPRFWSTDFGSRLLPLAPLLLCAAAVWVPGLAPADLSSLDRIVLGIMLGGTAGQTHKVITQTGLGRDSRRRPPAEAPRP